jgi:hypothetical protein
MARISIDLPDDDYERLLAEAEEQHEPAEAYAGRVLAQSLHKKRFLEGSALFIGTPGMREEFASRFGPQASAASTAA